MRGKLFGNDFKIGGNKQQPSTPPPPPPRQKTDFSSVTSISIQRQMSAINPDANTSPASKQQRTLHIKTSRRWPAASLTVRKNRFQLIDSIGIVHLAASLILLNNPVTPWRGATLSRVTSLEVSEAAKRVSFSQQKARRQESNR